MVCKPLHFWLLIPFFLGVSINTLRGQSPYPVLTTQAKNSSQQASTNQYHEATLGTPRPLEPTYGLSELTLIGLRKNPDLLRAGYAISEAEGRAIQAGLYPNPILTGSFVELGDRLGTGGINTFPFFQQELVLPRKIRLRKAVANREVEKASLAKRFTRFAVITAIRREYFGVLAMQQRVEVLDKLARIAGQNYLTADKLKKAKQIGELELLQLRLARDRLQAQLDAARQKHLGVWRRFVTLIGEPYMPFTLVKGSLENPLPEYSFEAARQEMLARHPQIQIANVELSRAKTALRQAKAERIPNVTIGVGYTRQNQNKSDDWSLGFQIPLPILNANQGNIHAAWATTGRALEGIRATEYDLTRRLAEAISRYSAARRQLVRYRDFILPDAAKALRLSQAAFKGGQFPSSQVLQAERALAEANLEYLNFLEDAWKAASEISGLLLEEDWQLDT